MTVYNEYITTIYMVTAILKIVEMTLFKYLTKGKKNLPENNAFGDKYNVIDKSFYM